MQAPCLNAAAYRCAVMRIASAVCAAMMLCFSGCGVNPAPPAGGEPDYSVVFLGDLHYDHPRHHDMDWVNKTHPRDTAQILNYSRITEENTPALFASISAVIQQQPRPVFAVLQAGDFAEGLCGSYELQSLQFEDAKASVSRYFDTLPFLITKGNHDITGPGAEKAYEETILPWLGSQLNRSITQASYTVYRGEDRFIFWDAYPPNLDWLEDALEQPNARYTFIITHMPVVPYDARSTWHLYADKKTSAQRERLLDLLGRHKAIVLCGHLHGYSLLSRRTPSGSFLQLSMNSVVSDREMTAKYYRSGKEHYASELVGLEPSFSPDSLELRKQILDSEKPHIDMFEYAKTAGFCVIKRHPEKIAIDIYLGCSRTPWKTHEIPFPFPYRFHTK